MGPDAMILVFWMLSFKPIFSLSSFTFKRLFSSLLSAIKVVSSAYLRLLIFLPAILIPACASSSPAFHIMYSEYKLNKQGDNIQPWCIPFPIWNQSVVPCPVLTVASWPACKCRYYILFTKKATEYQLANIIAKFTSYTVVLLHSTLIINTIKAITKGLIVLALEFYCLSVMSILCVCSVMSDSLGPYGLQPTRLLYP